MAGETADRTAMGPPPPRPTAGSKRKVVLEEDVYAGMLQVIVIEQL